MINKLYTLNINNDFKIGLLAITLFFVVVLSIFIGYNRVKVHTNAIIILIPQIAIPSARISPLNMLSGSFTSICDFQHPSHLNSHASIKASFNSLAVPM